MPWHLRVEEPFGPCSSQSSNTVQVCVAAVLLLPRCWAKAAIHAFAFMLALWQVAADLMRPHWLAALHF
jgi:hypothetical protein